MVMLEVCALTWTFLFLSMLCKSLNASNQNESISAKFEKPALSYMEALR